MGGRMNMKRLGLLSGVCLALSTVPVMAAFEIVGGPETAQNTSEIIRGFGRDLPVEVVAAQVIPPRFTILFDAEVDRRQQTSWSGGRPWREVLSEAIEPLGLTFDESGDSVTIVSAIRVIEPAVPLAQEYEQATPIALDPPAPAEPSSFEAEFAAGEPFVPADENDGAPLVEPAEPIEPAGNSEDQIAEVAVDSFLSADDAEIFDVEPPLVEWVATSGATLRETLIEWGETAGWTIAWQSERDYLLHAGAIFEGEFESAAGNLVRAFRDAQPPVLATFYRGNQVVVISTESAR